MFYNQEESAALQLDLKLGNVSKDQVKAIFKKLLSTQLMGKLKISISGKERNLVRLFTQDLTLAEIEKVQRALGEISKSGGSIEGASSFFLPLQSTKDALNILKLLKHDEREDAGRPSNGFMAKLKNPDYPSSDEQLYNDYIFRQAMELSGHSQLAWNAPIEEVKSLFQKSPRRFLLLLKSGAQVSLLPFLLRENGKKGISILVNEGTSHVADSAKSILGLYSSVKKYGHYDRDKLVGAISGIPSSEVKKLRENFSHRDMKKGSPESPVIVRIQLEDVENTDPLVMKDIYDSQYAKIMESYDGSLPIFLANSTQGNVPFLLPPDSETVVFHRKSFQGNNIKGKHNVSLVNPHLVAVLNNKYLEFRLWDKYVPGAMPTTRLLREFIPDSTKQGDSQLTLERLKEMVGLIRADYPKGFVIKGSYDVGTEKAGLITDKTDIINEYKTYLEGDYDEYLRNLLKKLAGSSTDYVMEESQKHPGYRGYRIKDLFSKLEMTIIQNRLRIDKEFRVEVVAGRVLGKGSTIERYGYLNPAATPAIPAELYAKAEEYTQAIINRLPEHLRGMSFTMDIALLEDGQFAVIESNPGGNSGFLAMEKESIKALNDFLKTYPTLKAKGLIPAGMDEREEMKFINSHIQEFGLDKGIHFPGLEFQEDKVVRRGVKISPIVGHEASTKTSWCLEEIAGRSNSPAQEVDASCDEKVSGLEAHLPMVNLYSKIAMASSAFSEHAIVKDIISKVPNHPKDKFRALELITRFLSNRRTDGPQDEGLIVLSGEIEACLDRPQKHQSSGTP